MTAINVLVQSKSVSILTDGLLYGDKINVIKLDFVKCLPIEGSNACVAFAGPAGFNYLMAGVAANYRFDDLVRKTGAFFYELFDIYAKNNACETKFGSVVLAGWLEDEDRPAAFIIDVIAAGAAEIEARLQGKIDGEPFRELTALPLITIPTPDVDLIRSTGWPVSMDLNNMDPERELLHIAQVQRQQVKNRSRVLVGGQATLTTITKAGLTQRVVHTWPEDQVGQTIEPKPIDWTKWWKERETAGMSRLKRERLAKRARKWALRRVA
jgi:hypothetical protein